MDIKDPDKFEQEIINFRDSWGYSPLVVEICNLALAKMKEEKTSSFKEEKGGKP